MSLKIEEIQYFEDFEIFEKSSKKSQNMTIFI